MNTGGFRPLATYVNTGGFRPPATRRQALGTGSYLSPAAGAGRSPGAPVTGRAAATVRSAS